MSTSRASQITPHHAVRISLPGRYGELAALHAVPDQGIALADTGVTALLVPGYTGSKEDFAPLLDPIAGAGIEAVAVDLPGQHESPGPDDESAYRPKQLGEVVAELVEHLAKDGRRVLLLGHSYGGLVVRAAVLAGAPVSGLVLLGSGPAELPDGDRRRALDLGEPVLREQGIEEAQRIREAMDSARPGWDQLPQELKDFLRRRFLMSSPAGLLGMADGLRYEPDLVPQLADALRERGAPCLVVCGESDDAWPVPVQRHMAERLDADFAVIPGAAHSPNTENPEALLGILLPTWRSWLS